MEYGYSCMGSEVAGGLGAKMAAPDREVYVMIGDGSYLMLANTNLTTTNWIPIGPLQNTNGIYRYVDAAATNYNHRYYRAQLQ